MNKQNELVVIVASNVAINKNMHMYVNYSIGKWVFLNLQVASSFSFVRIYK